MAAALALAEIVTGEFTARLAPLAGLVSAMVGPVTVTLTATEVAVEPFESVTFAVNATTPVAVGVQLKLYGGLKTVPTVVVPARKSTRRIVAPVPALGEAIPGYSAYVWMGLFAPKGTPQPIVDKLHRELVAVMAQPDVKAYYANHSLEIVASTPADFAKFFGEERERWAKVIKDVGAKVD